MMMAIGTFYGGIAQIIAGIGFHRGNTFGTTGFLSLGLFWESFVSILALPKFGIVSPISSASLAAYLFIWGLFTLMMFIGTLRMNGSLMRCSPPSSFSSSCSRRVSGAGTARFPPLLATKGVFCSLSAIYASVANVMHEIFGRNILPIFPVKPRKN